MKQHLYGPIIGTVAAGGAGSATSTTTTTTRVCGRIAGVYLKYNDTPPGTTDVTVKTKGTSPAPPTYNILAVTDAATDGWFYPAVQIHTTAGAAIAGEYKSIPVDDYIQVVIAQANASDSVDVWILLE